MTFAFPGWMEPVSQTKKQRKMLPTETEGRKELLGLRQFPLFVSGRFGFLGFFSRESLCDPRNEEWYSVPVGSFVLYVRTQGTMLPSLVSLSLASAAAAKKGGIGSLDPSWLSNTKA